MRRNTSEEPKGRCDSRRWLMLEDGWMATLRKPDGGGGDPPGWARREAQPKSTWAGAHRGIGRPCQRLFLTLAVHGELVHHSAIPSTLISCPSLHRHHRRLGDDKSLHTREAVSYDGPPRTSLAWQTIGADSKPRQTGGGCIDCAYACLAVRRASQTPAEKAVSSTNPDECGRGRGCCLNEG